VEDRQNDNRASCTSSSGADATKASDNRGLSYTKGLEPINLRTFGGEIDQEMG